MIWIIIIFVIVVAFFVSSYSKRIRIGTANLISGGIKTGKTMLTVSMIYKAYRCQLLKYYIKLLRYYVVVKFFRIRLKDKKHKDRKGNVLYIEKCSSKPEKPLIYSNMPIGKTYKHVYVPLDLDIIMQKKRVRHGSVVYINEVTFVSGSKDIKSDIVNDWLLQWYKFFGHFSHGGILFLDTQSPMDMHFAIKRSISNYLYIYRSVKLPFFNLLWLREMMLVDGEHSSNIDNTDPDDAKHDGLKPQYFKIISHKWWKYYDQYAYSYFIDDKPVSDNVVHCIPVDRKVKKLLRMRKITEENKN